MYKDLFEGLGMLQDKCTFKINPNIVPVVEPPRKIPFSLYNDLEAELSRLIKLNVVKKVTEPTEWVNSIVLVKKATGKIRLCLDPRNLNKAILRPHHSFPNIDDCKAKLKGSQYFSSLDANRGFWMIPLDEFLSKLCTFNTPFGRFRFLRLPFGINAAPEIFHSEMVKHFGDIKGVIIYIDDFLIHASTKEEHDAILSKVLERARSIGIKFNKDKCNFHLSEIKFIGHIFNKNGVKPDNDKIKSIVELPPPTNITELQ